jgi:hypothetical protein
MIMNKFAMEKIELKRKIDIYIYNLSQWTIIVLLSNIQLFFDGQMTPKVSYTIKNKCVI